MSQLYDVIRRPDDSPSLRVRTFRAQERPVLTYRYQRPDASAFSVSGSAFRASLRREADDGYTVALGALWEVTPTIADAANGEVSIACDRANDRGRHFRFALRRWNSGDTVATDPPRDEYGEVWHLID